MPLFDDTPPKGVVDRRDGNTKGECGITTVNCLFCKDQISASKQYVDRFDKMKWAGKNDCHTATCPFWGTKQCWLKYGKNLNWKNCPIYLRWQKDKVWDIEQEYLD